MTRQSKDQSMAIESKPWKPSNSESATKEGLLGIHLAQEVAEGVSMKQQQE